ncbi:MAG: hypothetical protein AAGL10_06480 [Pseudomonadota bacterium]
MQLFASDLYRLLGLGFIAGTLLVAVANADAWIEEVAPPATAAEPLQAPQPSDEFLIVDVPTET